MNETMLMTSPPKNAAQNPETWNGSMILLTRRRSRALITNVKRPRVISISGRVRSIMMGRRKALKMPRRREAARSVRRSSATMPGMILPATSTPAAVTSQRWRNDLTKAK